MDTDILIAGGSLGGVLAAKAALSHGMKVILTEETDWIGGQLTSQAVPPDEHPWIEEQGRTQSYAQFRKAVREHYKNLPDASDKMKNKPLRELNPGNGWVSRVAHEPKVALAILQGYLAPYQKNGQLELLYFTVPVSAQTEGDEIRSVTVRNVKTGETCTVTAKYYLDATDCGDLLPLVGAEYRTGAESRAETGEPDAPEKADPYDMQPVTYVAALGLMPREKFSDEYKIKKPETYEYFKSVRIPFTDKSVLSWFSATQSDETHAREWAMFDDQLAPGSLGFWTYRRIVDKDNYTDIDEDVSLINWPQNDYCLGNIFEEPGREKHRALAKELTRSLIYWLQNEAPNEIGTVGFPVRPRGDVTDTEDGIAKAPYIRESRRIVAKRQIVEQDLAASVSDKPLRLEDSVGVGHYHIDLHSTIKTHTSLFVLAHPFEIPLSAMVPVRLKNLIPACKNIGTTHLTNGCFREHPTEWNIGETAGHLAAYCIGKGIRPAQVLGDVKPFQKLLEENGVQLHWDTSSMKK